MSIPSDQNAELKFVVTSTLIVRDIQQSIAFYRDVLGATVLHVGKPSILRLANVWLIINLGGGPTDDKPEVIASPPRDQNLLSIFLNLRATDIARFYELWSSRGARFITEPKTHAAEIRCYMRDPDGYLIEAGQTTVTAGSLDSYVQFSIIRRDRRISSSTARRSNARGRNGRSTYFVAKMSGDIDRATNPAFPADGSVTVAWGLRQVSSERWSRTRSARRVTHSAVGSRCRTACGPRAVPCAPQRNPGGPIEDR